MSKEDTMDSFSEKVFQNLTHEQWDEYIQGDQLKGTVPGDGNTYGHTKLQR